MTARGEKGSAVADVVIAAAMLIFVLLPVFSVIIEKYIFAEKARIIRDAVDMANISAYNALRTESLGKAQADIGRSEASRIFEELLCANLNLEEGLVPQIDSIAEGRVEIISLEMYMNGFPAKCPGGATIMKPSFHSFIKVPIRPALYRKVVLGMMGRDYIDIEVHVDSEIPVNN